jgi:thymidine phosphorylase
MGAGRERAEASIDPAVGITIEAKPGAYVKRGAPLARIHVHRDGDAAAIAERLCGAFTLADEPPAPSPLVLGRLEA